MGQISPLLLLVDNLGQISDTIKSTVKAKGIYKMKNASLNGGKTKFLDIFSLGHPQQNGLHGQEFSGLSASR